MSVQKYLHEAQKKTEEEKRQKTDMRVQLAALEREANKSYRNDIASAQQHYAESYLAANPAAAYQNMQNMQTGMYGNPYYQYQYQMGAYNPAGQPEEPPAPSPRLLEAQKLRAFYESKGIKIPQEVLDTIKEEEAQQPEPEQEPAPEPVVAPEPAVPTSFSSFQDFYKQFYQQYQKQQSGNAPQAEQTEAKKEEVAVKEEIAVKEEEEAPEHIPVDEEDDHPYGKWVTVVRQEEEAKNAPVTLVEDEFTKSDPYFKRRQNALASQSNLQDSDEETDDRQLSLLEKKDTSARYEEDSDEDAPKKPVAFKKKKDRKRKMPMNANQGGARKRLIVSNVHEDD